MVCETSRTRACRVVPVPSIHYVKEPSEPTRFRHVKTGTSPIPKQWGFVKQFSILRLDAASPLPDRLRRTRHRQPTPPPLRRRPPSGMDPQKFLHKKLGPTTSSQSAQSTKHTRPLGPRHAARHRSSVSFRIPPRADPPAAGVLSLACARERC